MIRVNVSISNVSAERFWDNRKPAPNIQIATNINVVNIEKKPDGSLDVPFVLTINYNPSLAQMSLKGSAFVQGEKAELDKIVADYEQKKPPAQIILQSISNVVFTESIIISRMLGIPPPIPLPVIPQPGKAKDTKPPGRDYSA
ncbi:MAG: hypothetical protein NWF00_07055 [Candidatus Bathyarchaeota archaeon]|nr:hypothetical protein [Candidatus Bathyarchaeota archaeon]